MKKLALSTTLLCATLFLAGCNTTGGSACDGWKAIRLEAGDVQAVSRSLGTQVLAHNQHGERIGCWRR